MTRDAPSVTRSKAYSQPMWAAERILELEAEVELLWKGANMNKFAALKAENERLRYALERIAEYHGEPGSGGEQVSRYVDQLLVRRERLDQVLRPVLEDFAERLARLEIRAEEEMDRRSEDWS